MRIGMGGVEHEWRFHTVVYCSHGVRIECDTNDDMAEALQTAIEHQDRLSNGLVVIHGDPKYVIPLENIVAIEQRSNGESA